MSSEQVNIVIGTGQLLFAALFFLRIDAKALKRKGSPADITLEPRHRITRAKVVALLIAGGFDRHEREHACFPGATTGIENDEN